MRGPWLLAIASILVGCGLTKSVVPDGKVQFNNVGEPAGATSGSQAIDIGGARAQPVYGDASRDQIVEASPMSRIAGTLVIFPPGSVAANTTITIQESLPLIRSDAAQELGVAGTLDAASPSIAVTSSVPGVLRAEFEVSIPLAESAALAGRTLVLVYQVIDEETGKQRLGILPSTSLKREKGQVKFRSRRFGAFQLGFAESEPQAKEVGAKTSFTTVLDQIQKEALGDDSSGPGEFSVTAPTGTVTSRTVWITWSAASSIWPVTYDLKLTSDGMCTKTIYYAPELNVTEVEVSIQEDGTFFVCVTARDSRGGKRQVNAHEFRIDTRGPDFDITGIPGTGFTNATSLTVQFKGSDLVAYQVKWKTDWEDCFKDAGYGPKTSASKAYILDLSETPEGEVILCAKGYDEHGNGNVRLFSFVIDRTPPPAPENALVITPLHKAGVSFQLSYDLSDYRKLVVRYAYDSQAPATCQSGQILYESESFYYGERRTTPLLSGPAGDPISFRLCIFDAAGNTHEQTFEGYSFGLDQRIFLTSQYFSGNLQKDFNGKTFTSGFEGADYRCQSLADDAGLGGRFVAFLGSSSRSLVTWTPEYGGKVINVHGDTVASDKTSLLSSNHAGAVAFDENGQPAWGVTWTGFWADSYTSSVSTTSSNCDEWQSENEYQYGNSGFGESMDWKWAYQTPNSCDRVAHLYCLEALPVSGLASVSIQKDGAVARLHVDFEDVKNLGRVEIKRHDLAQVPQDPDCSYPDSSTTATIHTFASFPDTELVDELETGTYYYVACVFDTSNNLVEVRRLGEIDLN